MAAKLAGPDLAFVNKCNAAPYSSQGKLFLNAFWDEGAEQKAEEVYQFCENYYGTDLHLKGLTAVATESAGTDLDEHGFHYFLEHHIEPLTVIAARSKLREADVSFDGKVSFLEFLMWHLKKDANVFARKKPIDPSAPANQTPEMAKANAALAAVRSEINRIESEKSRLEQESSGGGVKAIRAKNELAQLLSADQTDLNRALLTAEAAVRRVGGSGVDIPPGTMWWMNRDLEEMKKYKPSK
jgi:F actin bundling C terminal